MTRLELTEEEREALLQLLEEEMRDPKYPLSPETEALRSIVEKLRGDAKRKPQRE